MNNHLNSHLNKNKGFSFIELLIAVTILSIIMIMVTQFMGTTSGALTKTKKNLAIQSEAAETGEKISDTLMKATYIRVRTQDHNDYKLDTSLNGHRRKREATVNAALSADLVSDSYPYYYAGNDDFNIGYDNVTATLVGLDENEVEIPGTTDPSVVSFRHLTKTPGEKLYVKPKYIYVRYKDKDNTGAIVDQYCIFRFEGNNITIAKGSPVTGGDGFSDAVADVDNNGSLLTEHARDCYFSADVAAETVYFDMIFAEDRFINYSYHYEEAVAFRNSNVLKVIPQNMYRKN